jgi:hypothetical protein
MAAAAAAVAVRARVCDPRCGACGQRKGQRRENNDLLQGNLLNIGWCLNLYVDCDSITTETIPRGASPMRPAHCG